MSLCFVIWKILYLSLDVHPGYDKCKLILRVISNRKDVIKRSSSSLCRISARRLSGKVVLTKVWLTFILPLRTSVCWSVTSGINIKLLEWILKQHGASININCRRLCARCIIEQMLLIYARVCRSLVGVLIWVSALMKRLDNVKDKVVFRDFLACFCRLHLQQ